MEEGVVRSPLSPSPYTHTRSAGSGDSLSVLVAYNEEPVIALLVKTSGAEELRSFFTELYYALNT